MLLAMPERHEGTGDISLFQVMVQAGETFHAVQGAARGLADKLAGSQAEPSTPATRAMSAESTALSPTMEMVTRALTGSSVLVWVLLVLVSTVGISCIFFAIRQFEQRTTNPPPLVSSSVGRRKSGATASASSLGSSWAWRKHKAADSLPSSQAHSINPVTPASARSGLSSARRARAGTTSEDLTDHANGGFSSGASPGPANPAGSTPRISARRSRGTSGGCSFRVPVNTLVDVTEEGSFNIVDVFSSLILKVMVPRTPEGSRKVELYLSEEAQAPCLSVRNQRPGAQANPASLELLGPNGLHFGVLQPQSDGSLLVRAQAQPQLVIEGNEAELDLTISARDGRLVAKVSCNKVVAGDPPPDPGAPEHVEITVLPGIDPVFVVACVLAILFLCDEGREVHSSA